MKTAKFTSVLATLILFTASFTFIYAQELDDAAMMEAWKAASTPGEAHSYLKKMAGKWQTKTTMWISPEQAPTISVGKITSRMEMGGRYLVEEMSSTMMGMPSQGMNMLAYDNIAKEFVSVWVDNFGTGVIVSRGDWVEKGKSFEVKSTYFDPVMQTEFEIRMVTTLVNENEYFFKYYQKAEGGEEFLSMKMEAERVQ